MSARDYAIELMSNWKWAGMQMNEKHATAMVDMLADRGIVPAWFEADVGAEVESDTLGCGNGSSECSSKRWSLRN